MDGWMGGRFAYAGGYDALRKQRSGFSCPVLLLLLPPPGSLPAVSASISAVERVLSAVGKTDPILGRDKRLTERLGERESVSDVIKQIGTSV